MKKLIVMNTDKDMLINEDQLIDLLSKSFTLGYLKAWERFSPETITYNEEERKNV